MLKRFILSIYLLAGLQMLFAQTTFDQFANEKLDYRLRYGFITGGEVTITSIKKYYEGKSVFHVTTDMRTIGLVDDLFRVHDVFESYLDRTSLLPYLFIRDANEGNYKQYEEVRYYESYVESTIKGRFEMEKRTYDIISALYALRTYNFDKIKPNTTLLYHVYFDEQIIPVKVIYHGKEEIKINKTTYTTYKVSPLLGEASMLQKKNPVTLWFTDDYRRIPVLIRVNFKVGAFKVELLSDNQ